MKNCEWSVIRFSMSRQMKVNICCPDFTFENLQIKAKVNGFDKKMQYENVKIENVALLYEKFVRLIKTEKLEVLNRYGI